MNWFRTHYEGTESRSRIESVWLCMACASLIFAMLRSMVFSMVLIGCWFHLYGCRVMIALAAITCNQQVWVCWCVLAPSCGGLFACSMIFNEQNKKIDRTTPLC